MDGALAGMRVLDLSDSVAGQYCCRLLADYGAEVYLVESSAGSPVRDMEPRSPVDGASLLFRHLNTGKRSIILDRSDLAGISDLADVLVVGRADDRDALRAAGPSAILCLVTDFGADGPYADWRACELIRQALSGAMLNSGMAGRPPLHGCAHRTSYAAGLAACIGILAAFLERRASGLGQEIDIAVAEVAAALTTSPTAYGYSLMEEPTRGLGSGQVCCRGEWVTLWLYSHHWADFCKALECEQLLHDPRFADADARQRNWADFIRTMQSLIGDWPADDVVARLRARRVITAKAEGLAWLARNDPHLRARGFWETVPADAEAQPILGPPFRMSATPRRITRGAPTLGETDVSALRDRWSRDHAAAEVEATAHPSVGALRSVRVLDLTTAWAGPMAGRVIAFLGAEVIHMEHATRVDLWRHHRQAFRPRLYADGEGGERPYNRNVLFNSQNINKLSLSLDLKAPRGLELAQQLAATCDVVLTNFTPGALDRAGLGYERLRQLRPDIIVVDMPAYGNSGPLRDASAIGATMEMAAGMAGLIGYQGGPPTCTGPNYLDPVGALNAATAILMALCHRGRTGQGQHVEVPQVEAAMQLIGEELLLAMATGQDPPRRGNRVRWAAPHDVFPALGDDEWIAIAATGDAEWLALCEVAGLTDLGSDTRLATLAGRVAHEDRIVERIAGWTRNRSKHEIADQLQKDGVAAAPVMTAREVATGEFYSWRHAFTTLDHPEAGMRAYQTVPIHLSRTPGGDRRAAPCLGQDTAEILGRILNVDADEIAALERSGVTSAVPA